jgi:hypothetical protein
MALQQQRVSSTVSTRRTPGHTTAPWCTMLLLVGTRIRRVVAASLPKRRMRRLVRALPRVGAGGVTTLQLVMLQLRPTPVLVLIQAVALRDPAWGMLTGSYALRDPPRACTIGRERMRGLPSRTPPARGRTATLAAPGRAATFTQ